MSQIKKLLPRKLKPNEKVSFIEHLEELRYRLIICLISVGIGTIIAYVFKETILKFLATPLLEALPPGDKQLIFTGIMEGFLVYLKASFFAGLMLSVPVILYQIWAFISPGLSEKEHRVAVPFVLVTSFFFLAGAVFGYYVAFPYGFQFLVGFGGEFLKPLPSMKEYLSFATFLLLAFGITFELPVFMFLLTRLGIVEPRTLKKVRKYAIPIIFTVAAIVTPSPDPLSQCLLAVPLCLLYELGIWASILFAKKPTTEETPEVGEEPQPGGTPAG